MQVAMCPSLTYHRYRSYFSSSTEAPFIDWIKSEQHSTFNRFSTIWERLDFLCKSRKNSAMRWSYKACTAFPLTCLAISISKEICCRSFRNKEHTLPPRVVLTLPETCLLRQWANKVCSGWSGDTCEERISIVNFAFGVTFMSVFLGGVQFFYRFSCKRNQEKIL